MNKYIALLISLVLLPSSLSSYSYNNKTFLLPRSVSFNKPVENSLWYPHIADDVGNKNGVTLQAAGFYQSSDNGTGIGTYFGVGQGNAVRVLSQANAAFVPTANFPAQSIIQDPTGSTNAFDGTITLRPKQKVLGGLLGYFQDLKSITDGLSFKLIIPFAQVATNVHLQTTGATLQQTTTAGTFSIDDYFKGNITQTASTRIQAPLQFGKITGRRTRLMFSDILASLNYNALQGEDHFINLCAGVSIPAGGKSKSYYLFEPMVGSGAHAGINLGVDASAILWSDQHSSVELITNALYTYFFNNTQRRIPELLSHEGNKVPWGFYRLGGQVGQKGVFPLANVLAQKMNMQLGSQIEAQAALAFHISEFTLTLGADLYGRQAEHASIKNFTENIYGLASNTYDSTANFTSASVPAGETLITLAMLDAQAAATPAQMTVKLHGSFGYAGKYSDAPVFFGAGAFYEFVGNNSALQGVGVWASAGVSF